MKLNYPVVIITGILTILLVFTLFGMLKAENITPDSVSKTIVELPDNLYLGLIAEDTGGNYETYLVIASVVRNRLERGMWHGLVALKRKDLNEFVNKNYHYVKITRGKDLIQLAKKAINEVNSGKDYAANATHYEHTQVFSVPYWVAEDNMKVVKVLHAGTEKEITCYKK